MATSSTICLASVTRLALTVETLRGRARRHNRESDICVPNVRLREPSVALSCLPIRMTAGTVVMSPERTCPTGWTPNLGGATFASPNRETEAMRDGSDAVADWPLLNALVNMADGASWVSVHHGGGVSIGYSQHAGIVVVADGMALATEKLGRVLTTDPGMGVIHPPRRRWLRAGDRRRLGARGPRPDAGRGLHVMLEGVGGAHRSQARRRTPWPRTQHATVPSSTRWA
jgi:hypothetical protein